MSELAVIEDEQPSSEKQPSSEASEDAPVGGQSSRSDEGQIAPELPDGPSEGKCVQQGLPEDIDLNEGEGKADPSSQEFCSGNSDGKGNNEGSGVQICKKETGSTSEGTLGGLCESDSSSCSDAVTELKNPVKCQKNLELSVNASGREVTTTSVGAGSTENSASVETLGLCLHKRPDALELNLAGFTGQECQRNHHCSQVAGKLCRPGAYDCLANCETNSESFTKKPNAILQSGSLSDDLLIKCATSSSQIGESSSVQRKSELEESQIAHVSDGLFSDDLRDYSPKEPDELRLHSEACCVQLETGKRGLHGLESFSAAELEVNQQGLFASGGRNSTYPESDFRKGNDYVYMSTVPVSDSSLSGASSGCSALYAASAAADKPVDLCCASEGPRRQRKISSAGIAEEFFHRRNIEGVPRSRSLPPPLTANRLGAIGNVNDKIRFNALADQTGIVEYDNESQLLEEAKRKWSSEFSITEHRGDSDTMATERKPQLVRSCSFRSNTLGRIRTKRSHSLQSSKSVEENLDLEVGNKPEVDTSNMAAGVLTKPKLPVFNQDDGNSPKGDPDMEELKRMLEVLKVDFVQKYSRDRVNTPGIASPQSVPLSPRTSNPVSALSASASDLQARLQSVRMLTNRLRLKHSPAGSPTTDLPPNRLDTRIEKAKSVDDILEEEDSVIERPIRRTSSAGDHQPGENLQEEGAQSIAILDADDPELVQIHEGRKVDCFPRERPGSPFKTAMSESFEQSDPGASPYRVSPGRSTEKFIADISHAGLHEIATLPRLRRVKDTSTFTKHTVTRKISSSSGGVLQRQVSTESTEVHGEHETEVSQEDQKNDQQDQDTKLDINVQILGKSSKLDRTSSVDSGHDTSKASSDSSSIVGERKSGDFSTIDEAEKTGELVLIRDCVSDSRPENRLSSEDEGLGITESDASTENVHAASDGAGKNVVSWSTWKKVIRPKVSVTKSSIAEQFNMIARQQSHTPPNDEEEVEQAEARTPRKSRRTVTHPTFQVEKHPLSSEGGSLDSNGLGSLHSRHKIEIISPPIELTPNPSEVSLADTGFAPSEDLEPTYEEVEEALPSEHQEPQEPDKQDKKTKSPKIKSKSDPTQKGAEAFDFPQVLSSANALSSPSISCQGRNSPELIITEDKRYTKKSLSDNLLVLQEAEASGDSASESSEAYKLPIIHHGDKGFLKDKPPLGPTPIPAPRRVSKKQRTRSNVDIPPTDSKERHHCTSSDDDSGHSRSTNRSAPNTPSNQSPTGSLDRKTTPPGLPSPTGSLDRRTVNTLSLSGPGRAVIGRSKSSASVFSNAVKKKHKSGNNSSNSQDSADSPRKQSFDSKMSPGTSDPDLLSPTRLSACSMGSGDSDLWNRTSPCPTPPKERSPPPGFRLDKRFHVVQELYNVEKEYVEALKVLVEKYMLPLKASSIIDATLVDNIFYKVPEIRNHHAIFLDFLERAFLNWDETQTVGQHIRNTFSKESVVDSYVSFIENYKISERVLENLLNNKSSFQKFVEQCQRDNRRKLPLKALIIQPAQRIPRYELLLRRLIEHTPKEHADHDLLLEAESAIHLMALKINTVKENKQEEIMQESLKQLELLLMTDLSIPERIYIRHDMVNVMSRKDQCCLWLFSDLLIISAIKRKTGTVKKASIRLQSPSGQDFVDNVKHKVWLRIGLDDVDIIKTGSLTRRSTLDKDVLEEDFVILGQAMELTNKLTCSHQVLEETIRDMMTSLHRQIMEQQGRAQEMRKLDLMTTTQEGVNFINVMFPTIEKRLQWEAIFSESKQRLASATDRRPPDFLQSLPITKTRAGMQFSCAAPIDGLNTNNYRDVWVCNSDGHVGHMCLLSLEPEPIVTLNTPVPGCNSRILCVCPVPALAQPFKRVGSCKGCRRKSCMIHQPRSPVKIVPDSSSSESDSSSSSDDDEDEVETDEVQLSGDEEEKTCKHGGPLNDPYRSTMWLGTEDGLIMIFQCTDNIKTTRNKLRIQHPAAILSMVHLDSKVFVSLANGDIIVYRRTLDGTWNTDHPETRDVGSSRAPVHRMLAVAGKLWCGCQKDIYVINPTTLQVEKSFQLSSDSDRGVQCMACSSKGVWIATQNSSKVSLFHATSCEFLVEVTVAQSVAHKLVAADDIIRQHKTACLRITALMACKDLLWVGTSAGIILTIPLPIITTTTNKNNINTPSVTGLVYGHTGHVRFLTCVEMPYQTHPGDAPMLGLSRRASMTPAATMATKMLVISGGDGYEDFRGNPNDDELTGKDDSTNHLLLWQV